MKEGNDYRIGSDLLVSYGDEGLEAIKKYLKCLLEYKRLIGICHGKIF
ncbi:hypothetical protein [[Clostridium] fimetarium]|nr:hypothetical protein [[Clostridium] fimetarium]